MSRSGQFDIVLRFEDEYRENFEELARIPIELPGGGVIPLANVATIREGGGPNTINRENARRRIIVRVFTEGSDLASAVEPSKPRSKKTSSFPKATSSNTAASSKPNKRQLKESCFLAASRWSLCLSCCIQPTTQSTSYSKFCFALPIAFVGGVLALTLSGQVFTTSAMVGFISLGGIATRNGLLLVSTYLSGSDEDGNITRDLILKGSLERMTPVLMTTLTTGIALLPLILAGNLPGREILYPVATVIVGGLITSTVCEFLIRPGLFFFFGPSKAVKTQELIESVHSQNNQ